MTLQQLRYFCVMAEVLHYTQAANKLYISQPSLSYSLAELEKELGVPLFEKRGKKTFLTKYGEAFLPYAKKALEDLAEGEAKVAMLSNPTIGTINLGYIYSVGFDMMPQLIEAFYLYQGNRNISFNLQNGMSVLMIEKLIEGSLDVAIGCPTENDLINSLPIFQQELLLVVSDQHPLAGRESVHITEIAEEGLISINANTTLRRQIEHYFREAGLIPHVIFEVDECNSMAAFVGSQLGVAIMPRIPALENYRVVAIPLREPAIKRQISLLWSREREMIPAVQCFRDFLLNTPAEGWYNSNFK